MHVVDIGGLGMGPDGRSVFEEGLALPIMPLSREGVMNEDLLRIVRSNVREPLQVEGDIYACAACNDEGSRRLLEMMQEFGIANLDRLGDTILEASREATLARIRGISWPRPIGSSCIRTWTTLRRCRSTSRAGG